MKIVSAGEVLWDLIGGEEHLGGAPLNFAANAHLLGHDVTIVSAVGNDARGDRAIAQIERLGLTTKFVRRVPHPTGTVTVTIEHGEPDYVIHRPAAYDFLETVPEIVDGPSSRSGARDLLFVARRQVDVGHATQEKQIPRCARDDKRRLPLEEGPPQAERLAVGDQSWIYFGTLIQTNPRARAAIAAMSSSIANRFYDLNLRKDSYTLDLVRELIAESTAIKMNQREAAIIGDTSDLEAFCRSLNKPYVAVTRGAAGCAVLLDGDYAEVDGLRVQVVDTVGAGDAFAAAFLDGIGKGWTAKEVGQYANRAGALAVTTTGANRPDANQE